MSSSVNIDAPTEILSQYIYFDAYLEDKVEIKCNACTADNTVFFKGNDWEHLELDWLRAAIEHLIAEHPEVFK